MGASHASPRRHASPRFMSASVWRPVGGCSLSLPRRSGGMVVVVVVRTVWHCEYLEGAQPSSRLRWVYSGPMVKGFFAATDAPHTTHKRQHIVSPPLLYDGVMWHNSCDRREFCRAEARVNHPSITVVPELLLVQPCLRNNGVETR